MERQCREVHRQSKSKSKRLVSLVRNGSHHVQSGKIFLLGQEGMNHYLQIELEQVKNILWEGTKGERAMIWN